MAARGRPPCKRIQGGAHRPAGQARCV